MDTSNFKVVCDQCDAKLASVFCHSDGAFLCPQCDAQVHSVNKLAQRHLRVPCQSCPVWAYREAKSRGRLLDMPLAACLTRNLQMDIFDGTSPCWPSTNPSSAAMGTPQSDASSPLPITVPVPATAGSPNSPLPTTVLQQASNSWPQNGLLGSTVGSQPQPFAPQSLGDRPMSPCGDPSDPLRAVQLAVSPFSNCSGNLQAYASGYQAGQAFDRCAQKVSGQVCTSVATQQMPAQATQSQHSQHTLQRVASQELMDAVDSMDVALLLDTFGAPLDQLQEQRKLAMAQNAPAVMHQPQTPQQHLQPTDLLMQHTQEQQLAFQHGQTPPLSKQQPQQDLQPEASLLQASAAATGAGTAAAQVMGISPTWPSLVTQASAQQQQQHQHQQQLALQHLQQQQQQLQDQLNQQCQANMSNSFLPGFALSSSEPMAVPSQRPHQTMRSLSGLSCMSQSGLSGSNTDGPQLGSARSSNTMLLQSLEQQMASAGCSVPMTLTGVASAGSWAEIQAAQRQLQQIQQLQQQQQKALAAFQHKQQQEQAATAALVATQQQQLQQQQLQQQVQIQLLQRAMTDSFTRTPPINISAGSGGAAATSTALAAAAARRDVLLRCAGLGLSDPGIGIGIAGARAPTLEGSLPAQSSGGPMLATTQSGLPENLAGIPMDAMTIAASAAAGCPNSGSCLAMAPGPGAAMATTITTSAPPAPLPGSCRSFDLAASSFGAAASMAIAGSGGSTSVSPPNYNTLAGAASEPAQGLAAPMSVQHLTSSCGPQMLLPGSAPPALGLTAAVNLAGSGRSCDLSDSQMLRLSTDGSDALMGVTGPGGTPGSLLALSDAEAAALLSRAPDGSLKELDAERMAQLNRYRAKRMLRMKVLAEGAKKVRTECRKQMADTRPRVRGRFTKANSTDALMDCCPSGMLAGSTSARPAASFNCGTAPSAGNGGLSFSGGWGLHGHGHGASVPHMQRIDEEGANEGQSPFMMQQQQHLGFLQSGGPDTVTGGNGPAEAMDPCVSAGRVLMEALCHSNDQDPRQQQQQQSGAQQLRRAQSGGPLDITRGACETVAAMATAAVAAVEPELMTLGSSSNVTGTEPMYLHQAQQQLQQPTPSAGVGAAAPQEDCVITEKDLAALGFDDLPQFSGGFSNAGNNTNEDMDESAESLNEPAGAARPSADPLQQPTLVAAAAAAAAMTMTAAAPTSAQTSAAVASDRYCSRSHPTPQVSAPQLMQVASISSVEGMRLMPTPSQSLACAASAGAAQQQQQQQQPRLSVLDRPIMYGTDRSQFSAAQLSLLDSILTDRYRPAGVGGRS